MNRKGKSEKRKDIEEREEIIASVLMLWNCDGGERYIIISSIKTMDGNGE